MVVLSAFIDLGWWLLSGEFDLHGLDGAVEGERTALRVVQGNRGAEIHSDIESLTGGECGGDRALEECLAGFPAIDEEGRRAFLAGARRFP